MREPETSRLRLDPVLRRAVGICIRSNDLFLQSHGLDVEVVIVGNSKKPDFFGPLLPVCLRAPPLLAFPRNPVSRNEVLLADAVNGRRRFPVAADINRRDRKSVV